MNKPTFLLPHGVIDKKPGHGKPCNRCGICCYANPCPLAQKVFPGVVTGPCPALQGRFMDASCGLVADPGRYAPEVVAAHGAKAASDAAKTVIGTGDGCDARFNGEPADRAFYRKLARLAEKFEKRMVAARDLWGME